MSRKHFIALSKVLAKYRDQISPDVYAQLVHDVSTDVCSVNPNFNTHRFLVACTASQ